jgi:hypothetical protein
MPASPPQEGAGQQTAREQPKADGSKAAQDRAGSKDEPRVDTIGQGGEDRDRGHIAERKRTGHDTRLTCAEPPQRHQALRHDGGNGDVRQQIPDLADAHGGEQGPSGQRHALLISILTSSTWFGMASDGWRSPSGGLS